MVWHDCTIDGDKITLTRQEIEELRDHYCKAADKYKPKKKDKSLDPSFMLYLGKSDVLTELLKMFDDKED